MSELKVVRTVGQFQEKKGEWDLFINENFPTSYYLNHDWLTKWWQTYAVKDNVYIFFAYRGGELIGLLPLVLKKDKFGGFPVNVLGFLGTGFGQEDFPIIENKAEVIETIFSHLVTQSGWHLTDFKRLTEVTTVDLASALENFNFKLDVIETVNPLINIEGEYSDYFNARSQSFRANFRKKTKRMKSRGNMAIRHDTSDSVRQIKKKIESIANESWQGEKKVHMAVKDKSNGRDFLSDLITNFIEKKILDITFIYLNDEPIAYLLGAKKNDTFFAIETAYKQQYFDVSPGMLLHLAVLERLFQQNEIKVMDLGYDAPYKRRWTETERPEKQFIVYNKKLYPNLIYQIRKTRLYGKLLSLKSE